MFCNSTLRAILLTAWLSVSCCLFFVATAQAKPLPIDTTTRVLRIGLPPEANLLEQRKRYQPLLNYLSDKLNIRFEIKSFYRHGDIIDDFKKSALDGAFFGSLTGALAVSKLGIEPIARLQHPDSNSSCRGVLVIHRNSGIIDVKDTHRKRMVFVDRATASGYLLPLVYFHENGISDYNHWFSSVYFSGTYEDSIFELLDGHADISATKNTTLEYLKTINPRINQELVVLAELQEVPETTLGLRADLSKNLKAVVRTELLTMHQHEEGRRILADFGAQSFVPANNDDYQPILDYAAGIDLNLESHVLTGCGGTDCTCRAEGCTSAHSLCTRSPR